MVRTPRQDLEQELQDVEFAKLYGAAQSKDEFAVTLAEVRRMTRVTQKGLADKLGVSQSYISKLEGGEANCTIGTVGGILAALGYRLVIRTEPLLSARVVAPYASAEDAGMGSKVCDNASLSFLPPSGGAERKKAQIPVASSVVYGGLRT